MFKSDEQRQDLAALIDAMNNAPEIPGCTSAPDLWFPDYEGHNSDEWKFINRICGQCPISVMCAEYAIKHDEVGIWGGLTTKQRRRVKRAAEYWEGVRSERAKKALEGAAQAS